MEWRIWLWGGCPTGDSDGCCSRPLAAIVPLREGQRSPLPSVLSYPGILYGFFIRNRKRWCPLGCGVRPIRTFLRHCDPSLQLQEWQSRGDRTVLVIAHRLQTIQSADQILVLRQGELLEHDQLMAGQDLYSRLVQQQQQPLQD